MARRSGTNPNVRPSTSKDAKPPAPPAGDDQVDEAVTTADTVADPEETSTESDAPPASDAQTAPPAATDQAPRHPRALSPAAASTNVPGTLRDAQGSPDDDARARLPEGRSQLEDLAITLLEQNERIKAENSNLKNVESTARRNASRLNELELALSARLAAHDQRIRPVAGGAHDELGIQVLAMPMGVSVKDRGRCLLIATQDGQMAITVSDHVQVKPQDDGFYLIS